MTERTTTAAFAHGNKQYYRQHQSTSNHLLRLWMFYKWCIQTIVPHITQNYEKFNISLLGLMRALSVNALKPLKLGNKQGTFKQILFQRHPKFHHENLCYSNPRQLQKTGHLQKTQWQAVVTREIKLFWNNFSVLFHT